MGSLIFNEKYFYGGILTPGQKFELVGAFGKSVYITDNPVIHVSTEGDYLYLVEEDYCFKVLSLFGLVEIFEYTPQRAIKLFSPKAFVDAGNRLHIYHQKPSVDLSFYRKSMSKLVVLTEFESNLTCLYKLNTDHFYLGDSSGNIFTPDNCVYSHHNQCVNHIMMTSEGLLVFYSDGFVTLSKGEDVISSSNIGFLPFGVRKDSTGKIHLLTNDGQLHKLLPDLSLGSSVINIGDVQYLGNGYAVYLIDGQMELIKCRD